MPDPPPSPPPEHLLPSPPWSIPVVDLRRSGARRGDGGCHSGDSDGNGDPGEGGDDPDEGEKQLASELVRALETVGFATVVNHGIPSDLVRGAMAASRRFFSLPLPAKQKRAYRGHDSNCGYIGLGMESHGSDRQQPGERDEGASSSSAFSSRRAPDYHGGADRKETFDIGPDLEPGDAGDAAAPAAATPWPAAELGEGFRDTMRAYFEACHRLHLRLLRLIALGLELPRPDVLVSRCDGRHCNLRLLHYPELALPTTAPLSSSASPSPSNDHGDDRDGRVVVRGARHTDFGTLTLVAQDDVGGLRVQPIARDERSQPRALSEESPLSNHESRWISVPPVEGALVVNVGDMLQMLTNGRLKATPHQVVSVLPAPISYPGNGEQPPGEPTTIIPERYSIAFFCNANKDTVLAPIPELVKDQGQESPKPEPVTAMEYLTMRLAATIRSA